MTERDFTYWLQGFFEISGATSLTAEQVQVIKDHIKLVMDKKTPAATISTSPYAPSISGGIASLGYAGTLTC